MRRACRLFDRVHVTVAVNSSKKPLFSPDERVSHIEQCVDQLPNVIVSSFEGLLVDYAVKMDARVILRGLRAVSDFEYEFQLAQMNHTVKPEVETLFLATAVHHSFLSSSVVKEVARFGGDVSHLVPQGVAQDLTRLFNRVNSSQKRNG